MLTKQAILLQGTPGSLKAPPCDAPLCPISQPVVSARPAHCPTTALPRTQAQPVTTTPVRPHTHTRRGQQTVCAAGTGGSSKSLYELLGVSPSANPREIKSAFRKAALKLHPDVNKAPDAQERFMEAKMAFQTLSDERSRAEYDRKLRMGFGSFSDWSSSYSRTSGSSYGGYGARPRQTQPEDNYTFEDLMRDLDKEVSNWAKERSGKAKSSQDVPGSLFEELAAVGEEFVEFLEDSLGLKEDGSKASATSDKASGGSSASSSSSSSSSSSKSGLGDFGLDENAVAAFDKLMEALGLDKDESAGPSGQSSSTSSTSNSSSSSSSSRDSRSARSAAASQGAGAAGNSQQQQSSKQDDLEAELAALKRKVGRDK